MFKTPTLQMHRNLLNVPVNCDGCGTPMTLKGTDYVCPTDAGHEPATCPTTPINAENLLVKVATQILNRVMNESTIATLTGDALQKFSEIARTQEERLQNSESSIEDLNLTRQQALQSVEQNLATYDEVAEEVHSTIAAKMGLTYESQIAQEELDKLAFLSDPQGLEEDVRDLVTHLEDADPQETMKLLEIFVREIRVGPESAEVFYTHPLPDEHNRPKISSDRIQLAA